MRQQHDVCLMGKLFLSEKIRSFQRRFSCLRGEESYHKHEEDRNNDFLEAVSAEANHWGPNWGAGLRLREHLSGEQAREATGKTIMVDNQCRQRTSHAKRQKLPPDFSDINQSPQGLPEKKNLSKWSNTLMLSVLGR